MEEGDGFKGCSFADEREFGLNGVQLKKYSF